MPAVTVPPRNRRLGSLRNSGLGPKPKPAPRPAARKYNCCENPKVEDIGDGVLACQHCYAQIDEQNIVAEVTFQEDSRGAATLQGGFIGENARHASTIGRGITQRVGGGEKNKMQETERNGRSALQRMCTQLDLSDLILNQACTLYVLSAEHNFSAGRQTSEVIAACLYAACRRQSENRILLIDISELLRLNVFRLGEVYKDLCQELYLKSTGVGTQHLVEVESLIYKYCRKLEFGDATKQVGADAAKIIRRMKRDWMVTGRHPAGLCGAAIILAARMNNFRRSIREVVWVAKVADITIMKRVEEFRRTKAAALTVDQFREYGFRLKHQHDPPILYESELKKQIFEEKKRKRQEASVARETAEAPEPIEISDDGSSASSREASVATATPVPEPDDEGEARRKRQRTGTTRSATPAPTPQEPRRDAQGFVIPALPNATTAADQDQHEERPKRGRRKKQPPEPIVITDEELGAEKELEQEIEFVLNDEEIQDSRTEVEKAKDEERAKMIAEQQKKVAADSTKARRQSEGITWWDDKIVAAREAITSEDLEAEFADDPEVQNCLLSEVEQKAKEQIWVYNNEDWLRQQQEKKLIEAVAKSAGRDARGRKPGKGAKRRRKGKMGDGTTLAEATTPIETPADANALMLAKRAPPQFSKYVNYQAMRKLFEHSPSTSTSASRPGSATPSTGAASRHRTPSTAGREEEQDLDTSSTSPTPAPRSEASRLQSPPTTQQVVADGAIPVTPDRRTRAARQAPASPPQTQAQATAGAEDEESEGDENDYVQDEELDYGSDVATPRGIGGDDDREDIGEDDYERAIDPTGDWSMNDEGFGEDEY